MAATSAMVRVTVLTMTTRLFLKSAAPFLGLTLTSWQSCARSQRRRNATLPPAPEQRKGHPTVVTSRPFAASIVPAGRPLEARPHASELSAVVVGGGAAGIAAVANLLEHVEGGVGWVDADFGGGRINKLYREVPSNTKVKLFLAYAEAVAPLSNVLAQEKTAPNAVSVLREMPPDETCRLGYAGDLLTMLTDGLGRNKRIERTKGWAEEAVFDVATAKWTVSVRSSPGKVAALTAPMVVFCTGSSPATTVTLPLSADKQPSQLDLDTALAPSLLFSALLRRSKESPLLIGVIGASHSAVLVLMNLVSLAQQHPGPLPHGLRIRWFTRSPNLCYAEYLPDGRIRHDNTGLKGAAAAWARDHLEGDQVLASEAGRHIERVDCSGGPHKESEVYASRTADLDFLVQAVGFCPVALPALKSGSSDPTKQRPPSSMILASHNRETGDFVEVGPKHRGRIFVRGMHGAGIAFPERVTDASGVTELAVGFWKFMTFLKKVVPHWVAAAEKRVTKSLLVKGSSQQVAQDCVPQKLSRRRTRTINRARYGGSFQGSKEDSLECSAEVKHAE